MRKALGVISFALSLLSHWWWELLRSVFYEKIIHAAEGSLSWDWVIHYGLASALVGLAVWLFWPELRERLPGLSSKFVLVDEAARIAYEAAERAGALEFVSMAGDTPEKKLNYFHHVFLISEKVAAVYGVRPPSRNLMPIPRDEYSRLYPVQGVPNSLGYISERTSRYVDVSILRKDLRKVVQEYRAAVRAAQRGS